MRINIAIATAGRPEVLSRTLGYLRHQTRRPDRILVCPAMETDFAGAGGLDWPTVEVKFGGRGSCIQRNTLIAGSPEADVILFIDDDFLIAPDFLAVIEGVFAADPGIAVVTGHVLADGILGPGLSFEVAAKTIADDAGVGREKYLTDVYNGYGCNMAVRASILREHGLAFDENLPLYGWLEDVDLSRLIASHGGRIVKASAARGVHLGVKRGRQPGTRIGYSQIANPVYLVRKGTFARERALAQMRRNILANLARSLFPEEYVDRRGRLRGHLLALLDACKGRLHPSRTSDLDRLS